MTLADQVIIKRSMRFITLEQRTQRNTRTQARLCGSGNAPAGRREALRPLPMHYPTARNGCCRIGQLGESESCQFGISRAACEYKSCCSAPWNDRTHLQLMIRAGNMLHTRHQPKIDRVSVSSGLLPKLHSS